MKLYMYDYDKIDDQITESVYNISKITKGAAQIGKFSWIYVFQLNNKFNNIDSIYSFYKLNDKQIKKLIKIWR